MIGRLFPSVGRPGRPLRIAFARIFQEANAFSPLRTERGDFERMHFFEGDALASICQLRRYELKGFLRNAELSGFNTAAGLAGDVECVPLFSALAVSGGPVTQECFQWLRDTLRAHLERAGEVDSLYLALHGSMQVDGLVGSPEGVLIADARRILGDKKLAVSYDLHANLSRANVEPTDILDGFLTNPHRDLFQTGFRAGGQLIRLLRDQVTPTRAWRKLPVVLGGGMTIDFLQPMRPIFRHLGKLRRDPRVLSAHLFMVHPFSDAPDIGWAVHVNTDNDPALAEKLADELAEMAFAVRDAPLPPMRTPAEAIQDVRSAKIARALGSVSLVDMADVVGTGSPGGNTRILESLVAEATDLTVYLPLHDPAVIEELWPTDEGTTVDVVLRGTPGMGPQPQVRLHATLLTRAESAFGRTVVLKQGGLHVAVCERPPYTVHPRFWRELGLSPFKADAIVQKALFHYRVFYVASTRKNIPVITSGPSSLDNVRNLTFDLPVWPQQPVTEWRSFDKARRAKPMPGTKNTSGESGARPTA